MTQYQNYPTQGPYGAPAEHPQAQTVLILGIVGLFFTPLAFVAWIIGGRAKKEIAAGAPYTWSGGLQIGYIIGLVVSILAIIGLIIGAIFFVIFLSTAVLMPS